LIGTASISDGYFSGVIWVDDPAQHVERRGSFKTEHTEGHRSIKTGRTENCWKKGRAVKKRSRLRVSGSVTGVTTKTQSIYRKRISDSIFLHPWPSIRRYWDKASHQCLSMNDQKIAF
jgi:hypothetical protein